MRAMAVERYAPVGLGEQRFLLMIKYMSMITYDNLNSYFSTYGYLQVRPLAVRGHAGVGQGCAPVCVIIALLGRAGAIFRGSPNSASPAIGLVFVDV